MKKTRKITAVIASVLTAAAMTISASAAQFQYRGDINRDDKVDASDVVMLHKYLTKQTKGGYISVRNKPYADANGDGYINVIDLLVLKRTALGKIQPVEITAATTTTAVTTTTALTTTTTTSATTTSAATTKAETTTTTAETTTTAAETTVTSPPPAETTTTASETTVTTTTAASETTTTESETTETTTTTLAETSATASETTTTEAETSTAVSETTTTEAETSTTVSETTTTEAETSTTVSETEVTTTTTKAAAEGVKSKTYNAEVGNEAIVVNLNEIIGENDEISKIVFNFSSNGDAIGDHGKQIIGFIDGTDYTGTYYQERLVSNEKTASYAVEDSSKYDYESKFKVYSWSSLTGTTLILDSVDVYVNGAVAAETTTTITEAATTTTTEATTTTTTATESESSDTTSTTVTEETTVSSSEETETTTATTPTEVTGNVIAPTSVDRAMIMHYYNTSDGYMSYSDTSDYTTERLEKYYENVVAPEITSNGDYVAKIVLKDDQKQYIGNSWCAFNILAKEQASLKNKTLTVTDIIVNGESVSNFTATEIIYDEWNKKASLELGNYVPANIEIKSIEIRFTVS